MKLDGRRASTNVDDRRNKGGGGTAAKVSGGLGIGSIIIALLIWFFGGQAPDVGNILQDVQSTATTVIESKTEEELAFKCKQFLASTEDFWTEEFEKVGGYYRQPVLVLYSDTVTTGCGHRQAKCIGPFYCAADECVFIDIDQMVSHYSAKGEVCDLVYAEIIGHEVGHHVEYLRGEMEKMTEMAYRYGKESPQFLQNSVRIELLADYYAGCWAHFEDERFGSISDDEIRKTLDMMPAKGDDYNQKKAKGYANPETFTHGTSEQRYRWFKKGLESGDPAAGRVLLTMPYDQL
jgi:predicted metalloprotease